MCFAHPSATLRWVLQVLRSMFGMALNFEKWYYKKKYFGCVWLQKMWWCFYQYYICARESKYFEADNMLVIELKLFIFENITAACKCCICVDICFCVFFHIRMSVLNVFPRKWCKILFYSVGHRKLWFCSKNELEEFDFKHVMSFLSILYAPVN